MSKNIIRLLIILPSCARGGLEENALTIASASVKKGWDAHVAFEQSNGTASLITGFLKNGVCYHNLKIAEGRYHNKYMKKIKHLLNFARTINLLCKIKPDVVEVNLPWPNKCLGSIMACSFLGIPTAVRFGLFPYRFSFSIWELKAYAWARKRNQQWIANSENNRRFVCESFQIKANKVTRIYNGTKEISFVGGHRQIVQLYNQMRSELGLSKTSRIILTVANFLARKGYNDLLITIPHIVNEFPETVFVWAGEGKEKNHLVNKVKEYKIEEQVLFLGYHSDVQRLLLCADLFVFPTHYEGHPNALIEAMAYGLPIVSSDASSIPELIKHKTHGLLFRTGDSCDLLETIRWALRHPDHMQKMAKNAQLRACEFPEEQMVKDTLGVLQDLRQMALT